MAFESLEERSLLAGLPFGALPNDTAEYMLGTVHVSVVLMESNGTGANNTENWTAQQIAAVKSNITQGLQWWEETLDMALGSQPNPDLLNFNFDFSRADNPVPTSIEPISRTSDFFATWVIDFFNQPSVKNILVSAGLSPNGSFSDNLKAFNNAQRLAHNADWAFTIFVVNDANDADKQFAPGGFPLAFSYSGGRAVISLASRPPSTYAHEVGIIFYARDEYAGAAHYTDHRGYYDTQNLNAVDGNPNPSSIVPSIMAIHQNAYSNPNLTGPNGRLAVSTMEQVGWKDSDGDGIFDVLDVPHALTGSGYFDTNSQTYRFFGSSTVRTLPNKNPLRSAAVPYGSSQQSDITINRLDRVQFRVNGEGNPWQTAKTFSDRPTSTSLSLNLSIPASFQTIEIRTIDDRTRVVSDVFMGTSAGPAATLSPGVNGVIRHDADGNGVFAPSEPGIGGWEVKLVDAGLNALNLQNIVEPDNFTDDTVLSLSVPGLALSALGSGVMNSGVVSRPADLNPGNGQPLASTLSRVFRYLVSGSASNYSAAWSENARLRVDLDSPATTVSLDAVANSAGDLGRLEAYDASNRLLARYTTRPLAVGQFESMTVSSAVGNIAYVLAKGHAGTDVHLDNLRIGPVAESTTDARGTYAIANLLAGDYTVQAIPASNASLTTAATQTATVSGGNPTAGIDFGAQFDAGAAQYQNPNNQYDVDNLDGFDVRDVFAAIGQFRILPNQSAGLDLLTLPPRAVPLPFVDVNGDNVFDVRDVFALINAFRALPPPPDEPAGGEGEANRLAAPIAFSLESNHGSNFVAPLRSAESDHAVLDPTAVAAFFAQCEIADENAASLPGGLSNKRRR